MSSSTFQPLNLFKMRVVLQKHDGGRRQEVAGCRVGGGGGGEERGCGRDDGVNERKPPQLFISLHRLAMAAWRQGRGARY